MTYGRGPERRTHRNFLFRDMHDGPMAIDYNLWILRNAHRTVLVDTCHSIAGIPIAVLHQDQRPHTSAELAAYGDLVEP